ncbi:MAG: hypothetical protein KDA57_06800 [Planctomycetales bacterium]|nr:hypothetical protein [Planctomycetales bacterium]
MKIVLDIDKLLADGQITADEYDRLKGFSHKETGSLAFNILIGFGVIATAGGALALLPSSLTAIVLGSLLAVVGLSLTFKRADEWGLLGSILLLVGSVTAAGGVIALTEGGVIGFLIVTVLCSVAAICAKSILLSIMATLSLSATVGAMTAYGHATYVLVIRQPTVTVVLFSTLALAVYHLSKRLTPDYERIAIAFARTSLFMVNLGFWVGSLWGDSLWHQRDNWNFRSGAVIPDWVFVIGWAVGLIVTGAWAARANRRWVVNLLAVFGAIHFYSQYFERLGATPGSILVAGLVAIAIAFGIVWYNKSTKPFAETEPQVAG